MRRCRTAGASGNLAARSALPEELIPFLDVLAKMLAEAVLRARRPSHSALEPGAPSLKHPAKGLESAPEDLPAESQEA